MIVGDVFELGCSKGRSVSLAGLSMDNPRE